MQVRLLHGSSVMTMDLPVLRCGNSEPLKMGVHAGALGLAVVCGVYNAAAWLSRRQTHLAVNAVLYTAMAIWEQQHVAHHLAAMRPCPDVPVAATIDAVIVTAEQPPAALEPVAA
jgi:hypothetical protein